MYTAPFSFEGRIRRTEYCFSLIVYFVLITILNALLDEWRGDDRSMFIILLYIPLLWFLWAQGAKRCHDLGKNGWWQIVPLYIFWLMFQRGSALTNEYGPSPYQPILSREVLNNYHAEHQQRDIPDVVQNTMPRQPTEAEALVIAGHLQTTKLEVHNVNQGLLSDLLSALRSIVSVEAISHEHKETVGMITVKHNSTSQELLHQLQLVTKGIELLTITNGFAQVKLT